MKKDGINGQQEIATQWGGWQWNSVWSWFGSFSGSSMDTQSIEKSLHGQDSSNDQPQQSSRLLDQDSKQNLRKRINH